MMLGLKKFVKEANNKFRNNYEKNWPEHKYSSWDYIIIGFLIK